MKRVKAFLFSVKSSISNKPMALLLLLLTVMLSVVICGSFAKILISDAEYRIYKRCELVTREKVDIKKGGEALIALQKSGFIQNTADVSYCNINVLLPLKNKEENIESIFKEIEINYTIFANEYFTDDMLRKQFRGAVISRKLADELGLSVGKNIAINNDNNVYPIVGINDDEENYSPIYLPYYTPLTGVEYVTIKKSGISMNRHQFITPTITVKHLNRLPTHEERKLVKSAGLEFKTEKFFVVGGLLGYSIVLIISVFFVLVILYVLNYIDKVNAKKYAVMNIVGARPLFLASATYLEIMLAALIGIGIGIGIENAIYEKLSWAPIDKFKWIAYIFEIAIAAVTVFAATTIRIIRRTNHRAIDKKSI